MRITVVGTGYVGLVTGACLAEMGNHVVCMDHDEGRIRLLRGGGTPIDEPRLEGLLARGREGGRLSFASDLAEAVRAAQVVFVAVGTPPRADGSADIAAVETVVARLALLATGPLVVVLKSTVPVGTQHRVRERVRDSRHAIAILSNPEFLKEGSAVHDFLGPDRVIVGANREDAAAVETLRRLYAPFMRRSERFHVMDPESAELTKYASNAMLATRISFMNELARLCECVGANIESVRRGMIADRRIGEHFLYAGLGFGGSCLPKDLTALLHVAKTHDLPMHLVRAVVEINRTQRTALVDKVQARFHGEIADRTFVLWGLAFKPGTSDLREAPSTDIARRLIEGGANVRAHDPRALGAARDRFPPEVELVADPYEALQDADGLLLVTEWNEYRSPDFERIRRSLRTPCIFDGRNLWSRAEVERFQLVYAGIGA